MTAVMLAPSEVAVGDLVPVIGAGPGRVLSVAPAGRSTAWGCPLTAIAVEGLDEPYVQPELVKVLVLR